MEIVLPFSIPSRRHMVVDCLDIPLDISVESTPIQSDHEEDSEDEGEIDPENELVSGILNSINLVGPATPTPNSAWIPPTPNVTEPLHIVKKRPSMDKTRQVANRELGDRSGLSRGSPLPSVREGLSPLAKGTTQLPPLDTRSNGAGPSSYRHQRPSLARHHGRASPPSLRALAEFAVRPLPPIPASSRNSYHRPLSVSVPHCHMVMGQGELLEQDEPGLDTEMYYRPYTPTRRSHRSYSVGSPVSPRPLMEFGVNVPSVPETPSPVSPTFASPKARAVLGPTNSHAPRKAAAILGTDMSLNDITTKKRPRAKFGDVFDSLKSASGYSKLQTKGVSKPKAGDNIIHLGVPQDQRNSPTQEQGSVWFVNDSLTADQSTSRPSLHMQSISLSEHDEPDPHWDMAQFAKVLSASRRNESVSSLSSSSSTNRGETTPPVRRGYHKRSLTDESVEVPHKWPSGAQPGGTKNMSFSGPSTRVMGTGSAYATPEQRTIATFATPPRSTPSPSGSSSATESITKARSVGDGHSHRQSVLRRSSYATTSSFGHSPNMYAPAPYLYGDQLQPTGNLPHTRSNSQTTLPSVGRSVRPPAYGRANSMFSLSTPVSYGERLSRTTSASSDMSSCSHSTSPAVPQIFQHRGRPAPLPLYNIGPGSNLPIVVENHSPIVEPPFRSPRSNSYPPDNSEPQTPFVNPRRAPPVPSPPLPQSVLTTPPPSLHGPLPRLTAYPPVSPKSMPAKMPDVSSIPNLTLRKNMNSQASLVNYCPHLSDSEGLDSPIDLRFTDTEYLHDSNPLEGVSYFEPDTPTAVNPYFLPGVTGATAGSGNRWFKRMGRR